MLVFNRKYFFLSAALFVMLVLIAVFVNDSFVRPYFGDYLVVIFLYYTARTFLRVAPTKIAAAVLIFSYLFETLQYFKFVGFLGLEDVVIAKTVIGYGFDWLDLIAYTLGILTVLVLEMATSKPSKKGYA